MGTHAIEIKTVTVSELDKTLRELIDQGKGDMPVVLSKDSEGNEYQLLFAHDVWHYSHAARCAISQEEFDEGEPWWIDDAAVLALILWPSE